jgi:hypothetical protein
VIALVENNPRALQSNSAAVLRRFSDGNVPLNGQRPTRAAKARPTIEELREYLDYAPETGILRWKRQRGRAIAGRIAGQQPREDGYCRLKILGRSVYAHRVAFALANGRWPQQYCDHINGDRSDNRARNLREATAAENAHNAKTSANSKSGAKGVYFDKHAKRWRARVAHKRRYYYCGSHDTAAQAQEAVCRKRAELHGEFARH